MQLKKLRHLVLKAIKDFLSPLIYKVDKDEKRVNSKKELGKYYFLFDRDELLQGGSYCFKFDKAGIPMVRGNLADGDNSYYYNPQAICQYALSLYNDYVVDKNLELLQEYLIICNWLVSNTLYLDDIPYWESDEVRYENIYKYDNVNVISSMSQSRVISVLLRAYEATGKESYKLVCDKAVLSYKKEYSLGSFMEKRNGLVYFEENGKPGILNHLIFALFGLMDYCRTSNYRSSYDDLLDEAIKSIKLTISKYDLGWWTSYDNYYLNGSRRINPATRHYHNIHIQQMYILYCYTEDKFFLELFEKYKEYDSIYNRIKMLFFKFKVVKNMGRL